MKKFFAILLSLLIAFSMVACKDLSPKGQDDQGSKENQSIVEDKDYIGSKKNSLILSTGEYIIKNNATEYKIVYSPSAGNSILTAIEEINTFVNEATGVMFSSVIDTALEYTENSKYISLGKTTLFNQAGITMRDDLDISGTQIITKGKTVFLFGQNDTSTLYAAYDFLSLILDFDYLYKDCYNLDRNVKDIELKQYNEVNIPDIQIRSSGYGWTDSDMMMANRMRVRYKELSFLNINGQTGHNSFRYVVGKDEGHEAYWYSDDKNQLCYTAHGNKDEYEALQETCLDTLKESLKNDLNATIVSFTQQDIDTWCSCAACKKKEAEYGAKSGILVEFMNDLRARLDAWFATEEGQPYYRDMELIFYSYHQTVTAPATYDSATDSYIPKIRCNPGVTVWYAPIQADYTHSLYDEKNKGVLQTIRAWDVVSNKIFLWVYSTGFSNYLAWYNSFDGMQDTYKLAKEVGAYYIMDQAQCDTNECYAWGSLKSYLNAKLAWDCDADVEELTNRFFVNYYGPVADQMKNYYLNQRVYLRWLSDNTSYSCSRSCSNAGIGKAEFWPKPVLTSWLTQIDSIIDSLDELRREDPEQYIKYYNRIAVERISIYYFLVDLYSYNTSSDLINEYKLQFKKDAKALGFEFINEPRKSIDEILDTWGVA